MTPQVCVRAPVRLHFGMFSFGHTEGPQFGGVGMMVEPPGVQISVRPAPRFAATGPLAARAETFVGSCCRAWNMGGLPDCALTVERAPDPHSGLGVGTQLGLAVATGLARFLNRPLTNPKELASSAGRGLRSAVGTYGFLHGGLIVDAGKQAHEVLGKLELRHDIPEQWRIVLTRSEPEAGLSGRPEADAFARLPPVPGHVTSELWEVTRSLMLPALERSDVQEFGEAVYRFNVLAGSTFAPIQGGPFASARSAELVAAIRRFGVPGVGQSSWGPTLFAITGDQTQAESLVAWLTKEQGVCADNVSIARPNNQGATIEARNRASGR
jgi:beta-ribofuranosylaminobenzene 5'-phosphate synthase